MKKVIVNYSKLTADILDLLIEKYPDGYDYNDIIKFQNSKSETISAVEVRTEDTIFLVKISTQLEKAMEDYSDEDVFFDESDFDDF
jgi:DNA-directed RNA polymerase subunit delta